MKLLKCKICRGEVEIVNNHRGINKKIKCTKCGFNNIEEKKKYPEIYVIKKKV